MQLSSRAGRSPVLRGFYEWPHIIAVVEFQVLGLKTMDMAHNAHKYEVIACGPDKLSSTLSLDEIMNLGLTTNFSRKRLCGYRL